jgi:hypothetical protein
VHPIELMPREVHITLCQLNVCFHPANLCVYVIVRVCVCVCVCVFVHAYVYVCSHQFCPFNFYTGVLDVYVGHASPVNIQNRHENTSRSCTHTHTHVHLELYVAHIGVSVYTQQTMCTYQVYVWVLPSIYHEHLDIPCLELRYSV